MEEFRPQALTGSVLVVTGIFLLIDALYLHLLTFDYSAVKLGWLDPYISHAYWGILFIFLGLVTALKRAGGASR